MCTHGCSFDNVPDRSVVRQQGWVGQASVPITVGAKLKLGYAQCTKSQRIRCLIAPSTACPATCSSSSGYHNVRCSRVQRAMQQSTTFDAAQYNVRCSTVQRAMQHRTTCDALRNSGCACGRRAPLQQMGCARLPLNAMPVPSQSTAGHVRQLID